MPGEPVQEYALDGTQDFPQVEPGASYWLRCPVLRSVSLEEVERELGRATPYPTDPNVLRRELAELRQRFADRYKPLPSGSLSPFLTDRQYFEPTPAGAVLRRAQAPVVQTGAELATLFEAETPGLWHRHVLNVLLDPTVEGGPGLTLSPPRQALIWAVLDVAIYSALAAAWHYKWLAPKTIAYRPRPVESDPALGVLYDFAIDENELNNGRIRRETRKQDDKDTDFPEPSPGTPRHPAYPSGHSVYSAAASEVLGCLFPDLRQDFVQLADDIGEARIWGGVHWRSDHDFGGEVGRAVGRLVIRQLNESGIEPMPRPMISPPDQAELEQAARRFNDRCGQEREDFCQGVAPRGAPRQSTFQIG